MKHRIRNGRVYLDGRFEEHLTLLFDEGGILALGAEAEAADADREIDAKGLWILPGLVDVHTHGRGGYDFNDASVEELKKLRRLYAAEGVTTVLATLASATPEGWLAAIERVRRAELDGIHLEGCFLNPKKRGAHREDLLLPVTGENLSRFLSALPHPCHITAALELDQDGSFTAAALAAGATLGLGHTNATTEEARLALARGAISFSHLYNAMPPLHHRAGGPVAVALSSDAYAELICDGFHVAPEVVALTQRLKGRDRLVLISDSLSAAGCPDGIYPSAGFDVTVKDGHAYTPEGAIAGSTASLFDGLCNLIRFAGISPEEAIPAATINPARMVGLDRQVGSIAPGKRADLLLVTPALSLVSVFAAGEQIR